MADFFQNGLITTVHDLRVVDREHLESMLARATQHFPLGLVLPVTAADMRAEPFANIARELAGVPYIDRIVVALDQAPDASDYRECLRRVAPLGGRTRIVWTLGRRLRALYEALEGAGLRVGPAGKGRSVWTAFGYLLGERRTKAFLLHDCDIVDYDRGMLARLCLPVAHPSFDFDFCKAYYARFTDRFHGRVSRLLMKPLLRALIVCAGHHRFLQYLDSFRYPLSGEFAVASSLARSNRIPGDWGLEIGTLAEVYRNTSTKRVCQVEVCRRYEHKHQPLSLDDPTRGLLGMGTNILTTLLRTLASMGMLFPSGFFVTLRAAYLREAQDAIRQYHADAVMNGLTFDRHAEEAAVEGFARQIAEAGERFRENPTRSEEIPNWARVLAVFPDFPQRLGEAVRADAEELGGAEGPDASS